jgi:hypothetical protein
MKQKKVFKRLSLRKCSVSALNVNTLKNVNGGVVSRVDTCQRICPDGHLAGDPTIWNTCPTQTPMCTDYLASICC